MQNSLALAPAQAAIERDAHARQLGGQPVHILREEGRHATVLRGREAAENGRPRMHDQVINRTVRGYGLRKGGQRLVSRHRNLAIGEHHIVGGEAALDRDRGAECVGHRCRKRVRLRRVSHQCHSVARTSCLYGWASGIQVQLRVAKGTRVA